MVSRVMGVTPFNSGASKWPPHSPCFAFRVVCGSPPLVRAVSLRRGKRDGVVELAAIRAQQLVGLAHRDPRERQPLAGLDLPYPSDVERAYRADLRIATRRLAVHEQDDGLAVAHHLDAAQGHSVR